MACSLIDYQFSTPVVINNQLWQNKQSPTYLPNYRKSPILVLATKFHVTDISYFSIEFTTRNGKNGQIMTYLRELNTICFKIFLNMTEMGRKKSLNLDRGIPLIAEFVSAKWDIFMRPEEILCLNGCKGKHGKDLWDKSPQWSYQKY